MHRIVLSALVIFISAVAHAKEYGTYDLKRLIIVYETSSGKKYGVDGAYLDVVLNDLSLHARSYPPQFDTPQDRQRATQDVNELSGMLDIMVNGPTSNPELLLRVALLDSIGHNLDIPGATDKASSTFPKLLAVSPAHLRGNYLYELFLASAAKPVQAIPYLTTAPLALAQTPSVKQPLLGRELRAFVSAYDLLQSSLANPIDSKTLMLSALRGMIYEADPDGGEYFTEEALTESRSGGKPELAHSGLVVVRRDHAFVAIPIHGGPAHTAGVLPGDELRGVDGKNVAGMSQSEITSALSGPVESRVSLAVFRPSNARVIEFTVSRAQFQYSLPTLNRPRQGYVVVRIHSFQSSTAAQVSELLNKAWSERTFTGVVLDLRGSPGGLLTSAIDICSIFLPAETLVAISKGRTAESNQTFRTSRSTASRTEARDVPMVVLVDEGTSSGAEVVAAALRDNKRARLVGRPTFGRGNIQTVQQIAGGGAIKFTSAFLESPSGRSIHGNPLLPDRVVEETDSEAQLLAALDELASSR